MHFKGPGLTSLLLLMLAGCGSPQQDDLDDYIRGVKAMKAGPISPMPDLKPYDAFVYAAHELRSPFREARIDVLPPEQMTTKCDGSIKPDLNRRKEELEGFALESLTMVGTWKQGEKEWALVQGSDRQLHRAVVGNYIGLNYGQIVEITELEIKIREIIPDGQGCFEYRPTRLSMVEE